MESQDRREDSNRAANIGGLRLNLVCLAGMLALEA